MSDIKPFVPFVSSDTNMKEFSFRAILLGAFMAMLMGAANAYLGLKAGMTIAATYTTAVLSMAVLRALKGTILEENAARTVGSIGGNIAAGAIFVLPAFFIANIWNPFYSISNYLISTVILIFAGTLGIMFVTSRDKKARVVQSFLFPVWALVHFLPHSSILNSSLVPGKV